MKAEISRILTKTRMSSNDIRELIGLINVESANSVYRRCADEFNFRTVDLNGEVYSTLNELAPIFGYNYSYNASQVLKRNEVEVVSISGFLRSSISSIRAEFDLSEKDYSTKFIDYRGFLTLAIEGEGEHCNKVREYLLMMEEKARTDAVVHDGMGLNTNELERIGDDVNDPIIQSSLNLLQSARSVIELRQQQLATEKKVHELETTLPVTDEQEHILNTKRDELVKLKVQNGWDSRKTFGWFYNTVKNRYHIGIYKGLARSKFPLVMDRINSQIENERAKSAQLEMPGVTITLQT